MKTQHKSSFLLRIHKALVSSDPIKGMYLSQPALLPSLLSGSPFCPSSKKGTLYHTALYCTVTNVRIDPRCR